MPTIKKKIEFNGDTYNYYYYSASIEDAELESIYDSANYTEIKLDGNLIYTFDYEYTCDTIVKNNEWIAEGYDNIILPLLRMANGLSVKQTIC